MHSKKALSLGFVALLLLSMVMLTAPTSANKPAPAGEGVIWLEPDYVNGSAVGGLGGTFTVELWANISTTAGVLGNLGCFAYAYWLSWNDTLLEIQSYSVYPPEDIWDEGTLLAEDKLKDMDGNTKYDRHSYSITSLGSPPGWRDGRQIAEYTFVVAYQPYIPEPDIASALNITDRGFADWDNEAILMTVFDGTYEIFAIAEPTISLTVGVSADPTTIYSGGASTITVSVVRTNDSTPVLGALVELSSNVTGSSFSPTIDHGDGNYTSVFTAPLVSTSTVVNITAEASKTGYIPNENSTSVTVDPDTTDPVIENPSRVPSGDIMPNQEVTILVSVTDAESGVKNVTLSFNYTGGNWEDLPMTYNSTSGLYQVTISGTDMPYCTWVNYTITAYDGAGNYAINDNEGEYFGYHVVPEFPSATIMALLMIIISMLAVIFANKRLRRKPKN